MTMTRKKTLFSLLTLLFVLQVTATAQTRALRPKTDDGPTSSTHGPILYDPTGNIVAIGASYYVYDSMSRVTTAAVEHAEFMQTQTYTYDMYGNRIGDGVVINPATNRVTSSAATYDSAGNLTSWQPDGWAISRQYTYDAVDSMVYEEVDPVRSRHHVYTADDQRYWTLTGSYGSSCPNGICSESRISIRDLQGNVLREFTDDGSASAPWQHHDFVYRERQLLASITPSETHHYSLDHLGTPRIVTAQNGYAAGRHTYFPFGAEITDQSPTDGRLRFTGHEQRDEDLAGDAGGQLDYMHARYYASLLGRFLSFDPTWESANAARPQSWNRYAYVMNNPVNATDPTGKIMKLTGKKKLQDQIETIANAKLHNVDLTVAKNGTASLAPNKVQGPPSPEQAALASTLTDAIGSASTTTIKLDSGTPTAIVDSFASNTIDVGDVAALGDGPGATAAGALGHAIAEQFQKQVGGQGYDAAHAAAIKAEDAINGNRRGTTQETGTISKNGTGSMTIPFTKGRQTTTVVIRTWFGNVLNVERR